MDALAQAKRVVALRRQRNAYRAMVKKGELTSAQFDALAGEIDRELLNIANQQSLPLGESASESAAGGKKK